MNFQFITTGFNNFQFYSTGFSNFQFYSTGYNTFQFYSTGFNNFQFYSTGYNTFQLYSTGYNTTLSFDLDLPFLYPFSSGSFYKKCTCYTCNTSSAFSLYLCDLFVQFCSLLTKLYDIFRGNSHWPYSLTKYFTFTIV